MDTLTDYQRGEFLDALDQNSELTVTEWEQKFIKSNVGSRQFSEKQRVQIDRLYVTYNATGWFVPFVMKPPF